MKKSKQAYYGEYFEKPWNNIKNTWKGTKFLISLKSVVSIIPAVLSLDNATSSPEQILENSPGTA